MTKLTYNRVVKDNNLEHILAIFGFFCIIAFLLIYYFVERNLSNYSHHTNCYAPVSDYSLEPGKSSDSILTSCGTDNNGLCCYKAKNLPNAINFVQINNGKKFTYHEGTKNVCIIDPNNTKYNNNPQSSVYTMNRHIVNQDSDGATKKENTSNTDTSLNPNVIGVKSLQPRSFISTGQT